MEAQTQSMISGLLKNVHAKNLTQFFLIYLFVFMTAFDSQKPELSHLKTILDSPISHFALIFGVYYSMNGGLYASLAVAIIVCLILLVLKVIEFMDVKLTLIEERSHIEPCCRNVKAQDILDYFGNDVEQLRAGFRANNIPETALLNDYTAPEIATYLYYAGHKISKDCL